MILPDVRGLHPYYEELALRFAERGIDAAGHRLVRAHGRRRAARRRLRVHAPRHATTWAGIAADIAAAVRRCAAPGDDDRRPTRIFTIGFCMGGRMSFLAATLGLDLAGRHRPVRDARRDRGATTRRRRSIWSHRSGRRCSGCSAGRTPASRRRRSRRSTRRCGAPARRTGSSPTRARRTASSTARRRSSPTRARRPGTRCSTSSSDTRPGTEAPSVRLLALASLTPT